MKTYEVCIFGYGAWPKKFLNNLDTKFIVKHIISNRKDKDVRIKKNLLISDFNKVDIFFLAKDFNSNYNFFMKHKSKIKNVIFEKPISNKVVKIKRIINECKKFKIKCLISYPFIYSNLFNKIITLSSKKKINKIFISNKGDGPIRNYIDPINDYIPIILVTLYKILKSPKNIKIFNHDYVLKTIRNKTNIQIIFYFNDTFIKIITGNNSKYRKSELKINFENGIELSANILKDYVRLNNRKKINIKKYDNISNMLEHLVSKDNNFSYFLNELSNEIIFFNLRKMILPTKYNSF